MPTGRSSADGSQTHQRSRPPTAPPLHIEPLPPGACLWRVQATNGDQPGPWSTRFTFTVGDDSSDDTGNGDADSDADDAADADLDPTDPAPIASHGVITTCGCATLDPRRPARPFGALMVGLLAMVGLVVGVRRRHAGAVEP